jgi:hypothetical protein
MFKEKLGRCSLIALCLLMTMSGLTVLGAAPASASCPVESGWEVTGVTDVWMATNVYSMWLTGPGTITLSTSTTATKGSSQSASVGVSYGTIIAKAEAKYSKDWSESTSYSKTWSYQVSVASGKTARAVVNKRGSRFTFKKWSINALCQESWSTAYYQWSPYASNSSGYYCYGADYYPATSLIYSTGCNA